MSHFQTGLNSRDSRSPLVHWLQARPCQVKWEGRISRCCWRLTRSAAERRESHAWRHGEGRGHVTPKRELQSNFRCYIRTIATSAAYEFPDAVEHCAVAIREFVEKKSEQQPDRQPCRSHLQITVDIFFYIKSNGTPEAKAAADWPPERNLGTHLRPHLPLRVSFRTWVNLGGSLLDMAPFDSN